MKKTLPSLKVSEQTIENMKSALRKLNQDSLIEISENDFRRYAYEVTSQLVLNGTNPKIKLPK